MSTISSNPVAAKHVDFSNTSTTRFTPGRGAIPAYESNDIVVVRPGPDAYDETIDRIQKQGCRIASQKSKVVDGFQVVNVDVRKNKVCYALMEMWLPLEKNAPKAVENAQPEVRKSCLKRSAAPIAIDQAALSGKKHITNEEPPKGHGQKHNLSEVNRNWNKVYH